MSKYAFHKPAYYGFKIKNEFQIQSQLKSFTICKCHKFPNFTKNNLV